MNIGTAALVLLFATPVHAAGIPAELARSVHEYDEAQVHGNRAALNRLLADDYLLINSRGRRETKAQLIADYTAPGFTLKPFKVEQAVAKVWSDAAIMGGVATLEGTDSSQPYKVRLRFTDVWARRLGRWQVIYTSVEGSRPLAAARIRTNCNVGSALEPLRPAARTVILRA